MADEQYILEDLEDEGEEVDYDDFNLEDEDYDEPAAGDDQPDSNEKKGEEDNFEEPPPDFLETMEGATEGTSDASPAKGEEARYGDRGQSTETAKDASQQPTTAGGRVPIPAPAFGKQHKDAAAAVDAKIKEIEARGAPPSQRGGRQGPKSGRGQQGRGPPGRGPSGGRQPHSRGPTPPPIPMGMNMPRPGPGMPGLPLPPGMLLPGPMMGSPPMQMMPRGMPMPASQPLPPLGMGPAAPVQSPDRQRGARRNVQIPAPAPPPREPVRWQEPAPGSSGPLQMGRDIGQRRAGPNRGPLPAVLPMPPNMAQLMSQAGRLPHPQPPPPGPFGGRQGQHSPGTGRPVPNGIGPKPPPPAAGRRGTDTDFNLALGMDGSAPARGLPKPGVPERLQGRLQTGPLPGLLLPRDLAEEQRQREERQEAERAAAKAREALEKKKAGELRAKKLEMARLQIALQQAENRKNNLLREAEERLHKQRETEQVEAMRQRVWQLERQLVAQKAAAATAVPASAPAAVVAAPTTSAPAVAAPPPANRVEPADPGLQVDFDDEEEEEKEPTPKKAARLPVTARLQRPPAAKGAKVAAEPQAKAMRLEARPLESERRSKDKMRLMRSAVVVEDVEADEAPSGRAGEGYTDLREFLSRKKRTREGDVPMEDSRPSRLQAKGQRGSVLR